MMEGIEFGKWYEYPERGIAYTVEDRWGTSFYIRGPLDPLLEFLTRLDAEYKLPFDRRAENEGVLREVLESGKEKAGDVIGYYDDRVRRVTRMDYEFIAPKDGPFLRSKGHLQIFFNEQYGGEYPGDLIFSSRAGTIEKVLAAIENMNKCAVEDPE